MSQPAADRNTTAAAALVQRATVLHQNGDLDRAAAMYADALRLCADHPDALHFSGILALQRGDGRRGVDLIVRSLAAKPDNPRAHANLGRALLEQRRLAEALTCFDNALRIRPDMHDVLNLRGNALLGIGHAQEALQSYDRALQLRSDFADAWNNRGNALLELGRLHEALESYGRALQLAPGSPDMLNNRGGVLLDMHRAQDALDDFDRSLQLRPQFADALYNRGNALRALQRFGEALESYDGALQLKPDLIHALINRGLALQALGRWAEALTSFERALQLDPSSGDALNNLGNTLLELLRPADALACYQRALSLQPHSVDALNNCGNALMKLDRPTEALHSYERALQLHPQHVEALNNCGNALLALRRTREALTRFEQALQLRPALADAHYNAGNALGALRRFDEAVACYERALKLHPEFAEAIESCAGALGSLRRHEEEAQWFSRLLTLAPDRDYALGNLARARMQCCDWGDLPGISARIAAETSIGRLAALPGALLALCDDPAQQLQCARSFVNHKHPPACAPMWNGEPYRHSGIRVAYISADFYAHATSHLMAQLFEMHDKRRFETLAISIGPDIRDRMRERLERCFDRFIDAREMSDEAVARLLREAEVDIAVDLKGFTADARPGILAFRPAPIQVNYLGYPGSMGADYIDYVLADRTVIPPEHFPYYSEQVVHLPHSYQPNDSSRRIAQRTPSRTEVGLPDGAFVFCCFNNNYKITPAVYDIWMRLLQQTPNSVLWLFEGNAAARRNLSREARRRGVDPERLVFAPRQNIEEHLARQRLANLFLDTFPCNAHTTASDALWAGLPVLTLLGNTFAGRVAASLLRAVGLPELVTHTAAEYESLALELALAPQRLTALTERLRANRDAAPLFDARRYCSGLELAYEEMVRRRERGQQPGHFAASAPS